MKAMDEITFCGRKFPAKEVELMRIVAREYAALGTTEIARTICERTERPSNAARLANPIRVPSPAVGTAG